MSSTRIDGDPGLADIAHHPGMVRVIAAVGGQIEGHRQPLLAGRQVAAVKGVGFLGRGEPGVLADGPGPIGVHGGHGPAHIGRKSRQAVQMLEGFEVLGRVERLDHDALRGLPVQRLHRLAAQLLAREVFPVS